MGYKSTIYGYSNKMGPFFLKIKGQVNFQGYIRIVNLM